MALVNCTECGKEISTTAPNCPNCGYARLKQEDLKSLIHDTNLWEKFGMASSGFIIAVPCVVIGILLSLTGILAIIGIPLIIAGLISPLVGLFTNLKKAPCPCCDKNVFIVSNKSPKCKNCKKQLVIKSGYLIYLK